MKMAFKNRKKGGKKSGEEKPEISQSHKPGDETGPGNGMPLFLQNKVIPLIAPRMAQSQPMAGVFGLWAITLPGGEIETENEVSIDLEQECPEAEEFEPAEDAGVEDEAVDALKEEDERIEGKEEKDITPETLDATEGVEFDAANGPEEEIDAADKGANGIEQEPMREDAGAGVAGAEGVQHAIEPELERQEETAVEETSEPNLPPPTPAPAATMETSEEEPDAEGPPISESWISENESEIAPSSIGTEPSESALEVLESEGAEEVDAEMEGSEEDETSGVIDATGESGAEEESIVRNWQAGVQRSASAIPEPSMEASATGHTQIEQAGQRAVDARRRDQASIPAEASGNIPVPPEVERPPSPPASNPIPTHTTCIERASDKRLPTQQLPPLVATPRRRIHGDVHVGGEMPRLDQEPVDERMFQLIITPGALELADIPEDENNQERRDLQNALTALRRPLPPDPREGSGQPAPLVDEGPQPLPPIPEDMQTPVGGVVARLLAQPDDAASDVMTRLRRIAYPNGVLSRQYPDIGTQMASQISTEMVAELRDIAAAAGVSGEQLDAMVRNRRQELGTRARQGRERIEQSGRGASEGVSESGQQTLNVIAGARQATDEEIVNRQEEASGGSDPRVIHARRDLTIRWIRNHVTTQITNYQNAGERRDGELSRGGSQQENAYNASAQREEYRILNPPETTPPMDSANRARERRIQDLAAAVRAWTRDRIQHVQGFVRRLKREASAAVRRYRSAIETAGSNAIGAARQWAENRVLEGRSWWERLATRLQGWFSQAREVNESWEVRRTRQIRDGIVQDLTYITRLHARVQQGATEEQLLEERNLTAEQRSIIREYFAQRGSRHPLDVAAARLRERLARNRRAQAIPIFEQELIAKPDADFKKLNAIGRAIRPGFDAAQTAQDVHAAMYQMGTDEAAIYQNLRGLGAIQGAAVRKTYRVRYRTDLDRDLRWELSGEELDRARLQLEGRQARADAVALHDAMGLLNTDENAIMDLMRGRSREEIEAIRSEYQARFGESLDVALNNNLDEGNEQDQASALLRGDRETADAISLDEAMRGGIFPWGTEEEEIEGTYNRVRDEVRTQAEREGWNSRQMEAEIRRRTQAIEQRFNQRYADVEQYQVPGMEGRSVLRRAFASEMDPGPERNLANALADNNLLAADSARIEIERRGVYASDEAINGVLRSQYERSLQATRLDQGPARRMTIQRELDRLVDDNPNITEEELSRRRIRMEHRMERDLENEAQQRSRISMDALQHAYSQQYGLPLGFVIAMNMSGNEESRARAMLRQGGRLTALQEIEYATRGAGTDEDAIRNRLSGMTRAEIRELREQWERGHPGENFDAMLRGELSGRDESDIMDMVEHGAPESASERIARERRRMNRELDDLTGVLGGVAAGGEESWLRRQMRDLDKLEPQLHRTDLEPRERVALRDELDMRVQRVEEAVKDHRRAIDSVTDTATQVVGLAVGVTVGAALTALTGGALGPVMIAVLASVAASLATMGTKQLIQGGSYGGEEIGVDLAVGVVDALTAAATAGMGGRLLRGAGGAAQRTVRPTRATRLLGRLGQSALGQRIGRLPGVQGIRSGMSRLNQLETGALTHGIIGENPLARLARSQNQNMRILADLMAEGVENAVSAAPSAFVQTALADETWEGNPALNILQGAVMGVGAGVLMGGVMQGAGHLYQGARGRIRLSTPEGRLVEANRILGESFQGFRENHPDASYFDFLAHPDSAPAQAEVRRRGLLPGSEPSAPPRAADAEPSAPPRAADAEPSAPPRTADAEPSVPPRADDAEPSAPPHATDAEPSAPPRADDAEPSAPPRADDAEPSIPPRATDAEAPSAPWGEPADRPADPAGPPAEAVPAPHSEKSAAPEARAAADGEPGNVRGAEADARAEALRDALPEGMRKNVPVDVNPELTGRTVRVKPEIEGGLVVGVRIEAGPDARPIDIMMHAPVVQGMQRYSGLLGRIRQTLERARAWFHLEKTIEVGSGAWEAKLELEKLPAIIEQRIRNLSRPDLDPTEQARLLADIEGLSRQFDQHHARLESPEFRVRRGRGYVAAEEETLNVIPRKKRDFESLKPEERAGVREWEEHLKHVRQEIEDQSALIKNMEEDVKAYLKNREDKLERRIQKGEIDSDGVTQYRKSTARGQKSRSEKINKEIEWRNYLKRFPGEFHRNIDIIYGNAIWAEMSYKMLDGKVDPCFKPGTVVKTPSGDVRIEDLRVGDPVYACNLETDSIIESVVMGVHINSTRFLVDIDIEGETISATRMHPFRVANSLEWRPARALREGMELHSGVLGPVKIQSVKIYQAESTTHNLEISGVHNYLVGASGILVHNGSSPREPGQRKSNFSDQTRRANSIYIVRNQAGIIVYVGKTYQDEGDPRKRFNQHRTKKPDWINYKLTDIIRCPAEGWTDFETAVWERYAILKYGGHDEFENKANPISEEAFNEFRKPKYGHNPCR